MIRTRLGRVVLPLLALALLGIARPAAQANAEAARHFKWLDVELAVDCETNCNPDSAGCATNPDCKCDCFR